MRNESKSILILNFSKNYTFVLFETFLLLFYDLFQIFHIINFSNFDFWISLIEELYMKKTETQAFGSTKRESHDASRFYQSKMYQNIPKPQKCKYVDNSDQIKPFHINHILIKTQEI